MCGELPLWFIHFILIVCFFRGGGLKKKLWLKRWGTFGTFKMQNRTHLLNKAREVPRFPALAGSLNASQQWPQLDSWKTCALPRTAVPLGAFSSPHTEERNQRKVKPNLGLFFPSPSLGRQKLFRCHRGHLQYYHLLYSPSLLFCTFMPERQFLLSLLPLQLHIRQQCWQFLCAFCLK